jgi:hypothetical protein
MFALGIADNDIKPATRVVDTVAGGYTQIPQKYYHSSESRHALGLVGGNDVSVASGNLVDIESDLRGTTRDLSNDPKRQFQKTMGTNDVAPRPIVYVERSTGKARTVDTAPRHLPTKQMFSYPGVPAPAPLVQEVYGSQWRF